MSRGLGVWQRRLLDAVNNHVLEESPFPTIFGPGGFYPLSWMPEYLGREPTEAERQAVYRAARTLTARGLIRRGKYGAEFFRAEQSTVAPTEVAEQVDDQAEDAVPQVDDQAAGWVVRIYDDDNATFTLYRDGTSWATRDEARAAVRADLGRLPQTHKAVQV